VPNVKIKNFEYLFARQTGNFVYESSCQLKSQMQYNPQMVKPLLKLVLPHFVFSFYRKIAEIFQNGLQVRNKYSYNRSTRKIKVSVFGSCRQDSLYKNFNVTNLRDGLTYPHYTKEIIQAIMYIKTRGKTSPRNRLAFRNLQIGVPLDSIYKLHKQFDKTDIFVVEIASRISYELGGDYFHHVLYDDIDLRKKLKFETQITKRIQSDREISEDMLEIVKLLEPKPVIFVTHFCSRDTGSRSDLRKLIVSEAIKLNCKSFDPSELLRNYILDELVIDEPVISHFSEFGHKVLAGRYQLLIIDELSSSRSKYFAKKLTQVLITSDKRTDEFSAHGIGDAVQGLAFLYRYAISKGRMPCVDKKMYFTKGFMKEVEGSPEHCQRFEPIFHSDKTSKFRDYECVFTNKKFPGQWDERVRDYILCQLFTPTEEFIELYSKIQGELELSLNYEAIHIRFGDEFLKMDQSETFKRSYNLDWFLEAIQSQFSVSSRYLILSDNVFFNNLAKSSGYRVRDGVVSHSGQGTLTDEQRLMILVDFFLLGASSRIYQVSSYSWGSNFSETASLVFNTDLVKSMDLSEKLKFSLNFP
jgi:hypothetical protein